MLEFEPARLATRSLGLALDLVIQAAGLFLVFFVLVVLAGAGGSSATAAIILGTIATFLVILGYPAICEAAFRGRTVGKVAAGLRVVTTEGAPIRFRHAAIRSALMLVDFWLTVGAVGAVAMLCTRDSQRLGDLAAGTLVLRERSGAKATSAVTFLPPPGWEPYAASLDAARITEEQYGLVRSFLLRVDELTPEARHALAFRLAQPVATAMHHAPPAGVHPEPFLICAAAAYQRLHAGAEPHWGPDGPRGPYAPRPVAAPPWAGPAAGAAFPAPQATDF